MELFYNPERMTEQEIRETFVAHQWLVDEILSILEKQRDGAGVQHVIIIAPRGMGKTTILLMLRFNLVGHELAQRWQPILFPEESYQIYDLADLWLAVLNHISTETGDIGLDEIASELRATLKNSGALEEAALARIKDWRNKNSKRLMLLIDNFEMILQQIGDERDNAKLRDVLMNDGAMMFVGGATTFFKEIRAYDQPLYNLFKIYNLDSLNSDQIEELLRRRARIDGLEDFDQILSTNASRLRVLEYFTGGNPRLVLMLYRVITHQTLLEVRRGLEKLLDEVTPYYKAKIENLPPQQRKILDYIARITGRTREGLTPTEIALETRLAVNHVSAQLRRLSDMGYVRAANMRGRSSYYALSEPLYAIWHQMRFGRDARKRMNWLVSFLKGWYDAAEITTECQRLQEMFRDYVISGRVIEARDTLEYRRYLMEAIEDESSRAITAEGIVLSYLELRDTETLKNEFLSHYSISNLTRSTLERLVEAGVISSDQIQTQQTVEKVTIEPDYAEAMRQGEAAFLKTHFDEAMNYYRRAITLDATHFPAHFGLITTLAIANQPSECVAATISAQSYFAPGSLMITMLQSIRFAAEGDFEKTVSSLEELEKHGVGKEGWSLVGLILQRFLKTDYALQCFNRVITLDPSDSEAWGFHGEILNRLGRYDEALISFERALELDPGSERSLYGRGWSMSKLGRHAEALDLANSVLESRPASAKWWFFKAKSLALTTKYDDALVALNKSRDIDPTSYDTLMALGLTLGTLGRFDEALENIELALELGPESAEALYIRAQLLSAVGREDESVNSFKRAFKTTSGRYQHLLETPQALSKRFLISLRETDLDEARRDWQRLRESVEKTANSDEWVELASETLRKAAEVGNGSFVRDLIAISGLEDPLFPLARALDYLATDDESLIEKLSPEVRKIVDEIANTLRKGTPSLANRHKRKANKVTARKADSKKLK